jgi:hypothetical protein
MPGTVTHVSPAAACERGRIMIHGEGFALTSPQGPEVRLGGVEARVNAMR